MNRDREYVVAGIEALLVKARAEVQRLEVDLHRLIPTATVATQAKVVKRFVRSAKARENMRKAQLARYAKIAEGKTAKASAKTAKA